MLDAEGAEAAEVDGLTLDDGTLDSLHHAFDDGDDGHLLNASGLGHGGHKFCFGHDCKMLMCWLFSFMGFPVQFRDSGY